MWPQWCENRWSVTEFKFLFCLCTQACTHLHTHTDSTFLRYLLDVWIIKAEPSVKSLPTPASQLVVTRSLSLAVLLTRVSKSVLDYSFLLKLAHGMKRCVCSVVSVVSDFLCPHGLQPTRLLCPWDFPGKNTGEGRHALLQGIFLTQESNPYLLHCRRILYHWATVEAHGMKGQPLNACKAPFKKEGRRVVVGKTKVTCPGKTLSWNWLESKGKRQNSRWSQHSSTEALLQKYTHNPMKP